jgi:DNA modification methylase
LRALFSEARRVLADDGTCWLNLGDSYSAGSAAPSGKHAYLGPGLMGRRAPGMEAKNLLGLPWRVALALQDDGWIIRNAIVWHKPNAMPESVRDRLNCRYELVFLLVKSRHYWFDLDPIRAARHSAARALPPSPRRRERRASAGRSTGRPSAPWRSAST